MALNFRCMKKNTIEFETFLEIVDIELKWLDEQRPGCFIEKDILWPPKAIILLRIT